MDNEDKRQWVHLGVGGFALLIRWLTKVQAVGLAVLAIIFNVVVLPKLAPQLFRDSEKSKGFMTGIIWYPVMVFLLMVFCPWEKKEIAAGAWAILACGDSFSNLIGRRFGKWKLPWNSKKSYAGLLGFLCLGIIGGSLLIYWVNPVWGLARIILGATIASLIAGIGESLDLPIDDNVTVGVLSGIVLYVYFLLI